MFIWQRVININVYITESNKYINVYIAESNKYKCLYSRE